MPHRDESDSISDFLIAEYNALQNRAISLQEDKSRRVNFFLVVVAAVLAGSASLIANQGSQVIQYLPVIALVAIYLLTLGLFTLQHAVADSIAIVIMYRRAGRIRLWFVEHDTTAAPYVAFHCGDDYPRMLVPRLAWRGAEAVLLVINAILLGVVVLSLILPNSLTMMAVEVIFAVVIGWLLQNVYVRLRLRRAEKEAGTEVHFPAEEMAEQIGFTSNQW